MNSKYYVVESCLRLARMNRPEKPLKIALKEVPKIQISVFVNVFLQIFCVFKWSHIPAHRA